MDLSKLRILGEPCFYVTNLDVSRFEDLYLEISINHKDIVARKVRGRKSLNVDDFFNEVAAALQFPYYFGDNWNALSECITDLDWLVGNAYVMLVSEAMLLMHNWRSEEIATLLRVLERANKDWLRPNASIPRDLAPTPFHVVFQCAEEDLRELESWLQQAEATFEQM